VSSSGERVFSAPGRVNLIGEHTDYNGGLVLPAAISRGVTISGAPENRIELQSELDGTRASLAADGSSPQRPSGWATFVQAVARELHELARPPVGIVGTLTSDVPVGAGLSSSAALEVAVATALCAVADWEAPTPLEVAAERVRAFVGALRATPTDLTLIGTILYEGRPLSAQLSPAPASS
jgi:galactokinase